VNECEKCKLRCYTVKQSRFKSSLNIVELILKNLCFFLPLWKYSSSTTAKAQGFESRQETHGLKSRE